MCGAAEMTVFASAVGVFRSVIGTVFPTLQLSDAGIAIAVAILLFLIPSKTVPGRNLLTWDEARNIRWDVLILFSGGLALADSIASTGLATWIGTASSAPPLKLHHACAISQEWKRW